MPYRDFDESFKDEEPIKFTIAGREFECESDIPADIMMQIINDGTNPDNMDDAAAMKIGVKLLNAMIGPENWQYILDNTRRKKLEAFISWFVAEVLGDQDADDEGKAEPAPEASPEPETRAPSPTEISSPTGQPSNLIAPHFGIVPPEKSDSVASVEFS